MSNSGPVDPRPVATAAVIERLRAHIRNETCDQLDDVMTLDPALFTSRERAELERAAVFATAPLLVAHSSEIREAGAFVRLHLPNNEVILVRQGDGSVRASVNRCRHRGSLLERREADRCRTFTCPYHGWVYGTGGELRAVSPRPLPPRDATF